MDKCKELFQNTLIRTQYILIAFSVHFPETLVISSTGQASKAVPECLGRSLKIQKYIRRFDQFLGFPRCLECSSTDGQFGSRMRGRSSSSTPPQGTLYMLRLCDQTCTYQTIILHKAHYICLDYLDKLASTKLS